MLTLNDIINVSFRKSNFSGYRSEDVDDFIDEVKDSYDLLIQKNIAQKETNDALTAENERLREENETLKANVDKYQTDADEIKNALISAQKLSEASIREARHKAEIILKDANLKAERIVSSAEAEILEQKTELDQIRQAVTDFRSKLLDMYKEHLTLINALPCKKSGVVANPPVVIPAEAPDPVQQEDTQVFTPPPMPPATMPDAAPPVAVPAMETVPPEASPAPVVAAMPPADAGPIQPGPREALEPVKTEELPTVVKVPDVDEADTQSFTLNDNEPEPKEEPTDPVLPADLRYNVLKFGDDYDINSEAESPVGIFRRNRK